MKPTGIIFDMDGTLLDSMGMWLNAGELYLQTLNLEPEKDLGKKLIEMNMEEGAAYLKKNYNLPLSIEEINQGVINVLKLQYAEKIQPKKGALEFLRRLTEMNIPFSIATNTDRELFEPCLKRLGIYGIFKQIITCSEAGASKSQPDIYLKAAEFLNSPVETTLVFEDAPYALKTARLAGFPTVGIYDEFTAVYTDLSSIIHYSTYYCQSYQDAEKIFS